jgi:hypothetical protein
VSIEELTGTLEALKALQHRIDAEVPRWIPVTERLPPVDEKVLYTCFIEGDAHGDYFIEVNAGYWDGKAKNLPGNPAMKYDDSDDWEPCSHWMPLPAPPTDGK